MNKAWKRLIFAAVISSGGALATVQWHQWSQSQDFVTRRQEKPVATLTYSSGDEVERRSKSHVIWREAFLGEELFEGEAIRTSEGSEARIVLSDSGVSINLEPSSLIVLEKNSLQFKAGNLFVDLGQSGNSEFKITSDKGEVAATRGSLSLGQSGDSLDLQVMSGVAQVKSGDKSLRLDPNQLGSIGADGLSKDENPIVVLSPQALSPVFADFDKRDRVSFEWEAMDRAFRLYIESSPDRDPKNFKPVHSRALTGSAGKAKVSFPYQHRYFRLRAFKGNEVRKSGIQALNLVRVRSPFPKSPQADETVVLKSADEPVQFHWSNRMNYKNLYLEISQSPQLKDSKLIRLSQDNSLFTPELYVHNLEKEGDYFWRLTGYVEGYEKPITNPIQSFKLIIGQRLVVPKAIEPINGQKLNLSQINASGLYIKWENIPGIEEYELMLLSESGKKDAIQEIKVRQNFYSVSDIKPGTYKWQVAAVNQEGQKSNFSAAEKFVVEDLPTLHWADTKTTHYYVTSNATLNFAIKDEFEEARSWRFKIAQESEGLDDAPWNSLGLSSVQKRSQQSFVYWEGDIPNSGRYLLQAQAIDASGNALAESLPRLIQVEEKPLLESPQWEKRAPASFTASGNGSLDLQWQKLDASVGYLIELKNSKGEVVSQTKVLQTRHRFKQLYPGQYSLVIYGFDEHGRQGRASLAKRVEVPEKSSVLAPQIRQIKVK